MKRTSKPADVVSGAEIEILKAFKTNCKSKLFTFHASATGNIAFVDRTLIAIVAIVIILTTYFSINQSKFVKSFAKNIEKSDNKHTAVASGGTLTNTNAIETAL